MRQKRNVLREENEREQNVITSLKALSLCTVPRKAGTCLGAATAVFHGTLARQSNTFKSTFQIETLLTRIFFSCQFFNQCIAQGDTTNDGQVTVVLALRYFWILYIAILVL